MPLVFVRVGNIVHPTRHEELAVCNVMIYMYNAAHTLASLVSFRANGLWLHIFTCYMQGGCCGSWPVARLFVKQLMWGRGHVAYRPSRCL